MKKLYTFLLIILMFAFNTQATDLYIDAEIKHKFITLKANEEISITLETFLTGGANQVNLFFKCDHNLLTVELIDSKGIVEKSSGLIELKAKANDLNMPWRQAKFKLTNNCERTVDLSLIAQRVGDNDDALTYVNKSANMLVEFITYPIVRVAQFCGVMFKTIKEAVASYS